MRAVAPTGAPGRGPGAARASRRKAPVWALPLLVWSAACQTASPLPVSPEGIRQLEASFPTRPFIPPPRTLTDITVILDQQKLADPDAAAEARARADQKPPNTADPDALAQFYYQRGRAAAEIGRARQEIEDLGEAARWAARGSGRDEHEILFWLSIAEMTGGNFSRSIEYTRRAIGKVPRLQEGWLVNLHANLASVYARAGDMEAAEAALREAVRVFDASRTWWMFYPSEAIAAMTAGRAEAEAGLLMAKGQFAEAEGSYRRAIAAVAGDPVLAKHPWLDYLMGRLAEALVRQERLVEAEAEARAALLGALRKRGRSSAHTAHVLATLAYVIFEQGRFAEAETLARAAIDIHRAAGSAPDSLLLAVARTWLGATLVTQGRWQEALAQYELIRSGMAGDPQSYRRYLAGDFGWALALLNTGHPDRALELLRVALERSERLGEKYASTAHIRGLLAMAYAAKGDRPRALQECAEATRVLLNRPLEVDEEATSRRAQDHLRVLILSACMGLLADARGTPLEGQAGVDAAAEAFRLADAARGREVQRALDASAARAAARVPALGELVRREQDARKQVSALYGLLADALAQPAEEKQAKVLEALRAQAERVRLARQELTDRIARQFPAYAQLINPPPITVEQARAALRPGEALIATYVAPDRTFVWAVPKAGPVAFAAAPLAEKALEAIVATLRKALDPGAKVLGDIPAFDVAAAHRLYAALLEPVKAGWEKAESLLIVPHGPLGQLPFSILPTRQAALGPEQGAFFANYRAVPWLARSHAVTTLPSVTSLATLRSAPAGDPRRRPFVGFGDPYFSREQAQRAAAQAAPPAVAALGTRGMPISLRSAPETRKFDSSKLAMLPRLPDTAEELRGIALDLHADPIKDVFLGPQANEKVVKSLELAGYRVLAFATHGLVPGDLDGLTQPALALSAPEVAGVEGEDGLLTMEEILGLRLDADWVVLSACNTASGQGAGAEAVSGLGRAFFYAGSRALLVSNWPVETTSARALTTDLFRRQRANPSLTRAQALRETMNALMDGPGLVDARTNRVVFSYAHPIFWAPFSLVGDGGGEAAAGK